MGDTRETPIRVAVGMDLGMISYGVTMLSCFRTYCIFRPIGSRAIRHLATPWVSLHPGCFLPWWKKHNPIFIKPPIMRCCLMYWYLRHSFFESAHVLHTLYESTRLHHLELFRIPPQILWARIPEPGGKRFRKRCGMTLDTIYPTGDSYPLAMSE